MHPESKEWKRVGRHLDAIEIGIDDAIHKGFCKEDWAILSDKLTVIEERARLAKKIVEREHDNE